MDEKKLCKYCKSEIPKDAKICPHCRKKQKGKAGLIALIVIAVIAVIGIIGSGGDDTSKIDNSTATTNSDETATPASDTDSDGDTTETESDTEAEGEEASDESSGSDGVVEVGGSYEDNGLKFTVTSSELDYQVEDQYGLYALDDGYVYLAVSFTFENTGDGDKYVSISDFDCYADNQTCEQKFISSATGDFYNTNLSSGRNVSFTALYAVPAEAETIELEYTSNIWTSEKVIVRVK